MTEQKTQQAQTEVAQNAASGVLPKPVESESAFQRFEQGLDSPASPTFLADG